MGNKQESEIQVQVYELTVITVTWWDSNHNGNVVIDDYTPFRRGRLTRKGSGVALYVSSQVECIVLNPGKREESAESLCV